MIEKPKPRAYFIMPHPCYGRSFDGGNPNCKICDLSDQCRAKLKMGGRS